MPVIEMASFDHITTFVALKDNCQQFGIVECGTASMLDTTAWSVVLGQFTDGWHYSPSFRKRRLRLGSVLEACVLRDMEAQVDHGSCLDHFEGFKRDVLVVQVSK